MKICCKLLAILFKALLSYLKYFIDFQGLERTPMNIVSSCMEPAWTHCAYLDTPQRIVWLLRQNHPLGSPEKKAQTKHMQQQSQTLYTLQSGKKKIKKSKSGVLEQNDCALCSQFGDNFTTKGNLAKCFAVRYP